MNKYEDEVESDETLLLLRRGRRRHAISEIVATLLMVAATLVAGTAVFGYVNNQAGVSEGQYGQAVANNVNYLREHFVIVSVQFAGCSTFNGQRYCNQASVAVYNNGAVDLTISQITLKNVTSLAPDGATMVPRMLVTSTAASTSVTCGSSSGSGAGFTSSPAQPIKQSVVPPSTLTVTLPALVCTQTNQGILVGASYQVQALGAYGNIVATQVTASG